MGYERHLKVNATQTQKKSCLNTGSVKTESFKGRILDVTTCFPSKKSSSTDQTRHFELMVMTENECSRVGLYRLVGWSSDS